MIRFNKNQYQKDIYTIRGQIRANGSNVNFASVQLLFDPIPTLNLWVYINYAFQPNTRMPGPNASLYMLGFRNAVVPQPQPNNYYTFASLDGGNPLVVPGRTATNLPINPTYPSLGGLPLFTYQDIRVSLNTLNNYPNIPAGILNHCIATLIVATSEAIRFENIMQNVAALINNPVAPAYQTPPGVTKWDSHGLGLQA